jgi:hypothetical protein
MILLLSLGSIIYQFATVRSPVASAATMPVGRIVCSRQLTTNNRQLVYPLPPVVGKFLIPQKTIRKILSAKDLHVKT